MNVEQFKEKTFQSLVRKIYIKYFLCNSENKGLQKNNRIFFQEILKSTIKFAFLIDFFYVRP